MDINEQSHLATLGSAHSIPTIWSYHVLGDKMDEDYEGRLPAILMIQQLADHGTEEESVQDRELMVGLPY